MRIHDPENTAKAIAAGIELTHCPASDRQRVSGIYRRAVMLASGRYALLQNGREFSLVPWRPVVERHLGQSVSSRRAGVLGDWAEQRHLPLSGRQATNLLKTPDDRIYPTR